MTQVDYHADGRLFVARMDDPLGNRTEVEAFDFRALEPARVRDINDNLSEVVFDVLGRVAGEAERGKGAEGDSLTGFDPDPGQPAIDAFFADPLGQAAALLGHAGMRVVHDRSDQPAWTATIERTRHAADGAGPGELLIAFAYTSGGGGVVTTKTRAAPGPAQTVTLAGETATVATVDADPRWIGDGRRVLDNKGQTVMAYEPYFAATHHYERAPELVEQGVTDVVHFDPLGRVDRTDYPDGTFSRMERTAWGSRTFDRGDTVLGSDWYAARIGGAMGADARDAAQKSLLYDDTPAETHVDPLGEDIWSVAHIRGLDRVTGLPVDTFPATRVIRRATGQPVETIDPRGNAVIRYRHDLTGRPVETASMETGLRRMFPDATDKPVMGWDAKGGRSRTAYDLLGRPVLHFYRPAAGPEAARERLVYGTDPLTNSNGALVTHFDNAGRIDHTAFDFKGNILRSERRFTVAMAEPDWTAVATVPMAAESHISEADWDAQNRVTARRTADGSETRFAYDPGGLLVGESVSVRGGPLRDVIRAVEHDAHRRRTRIDYANGATSRFAFDPLTQRILSVQTTRAGDGAVLQDLRYTWDAAGNVTLLRDHAQQAVFFNNQVTDATQRFTYDSAGRLIRAEGREHVAGQTAPDRTDAARTGLAHPADGAAMQGYREFYTYDLADNLVEQVHNAGVGAFQHRWTRTHTVDAGTNRLTASALGAQVTGFAYDAHGNLSQIPGLGAVAWDDADRMAALDLGGGGSAAYTYDGDGNRVRKLVDRGGGLTEERLYVGAVEIFRRRQGAVIVLERETLHLLDGKRRLAMVETRTQGADTGPAELTRYQFSNHLGTVAVELDETAAVISHEEYYPFGATSVQARAAGREVPAKRYRHTGKERDEESGLYYHGARYYMSWLCRWTAPDPAGLGDGLNQWTYARNNPVRLADPTGALSWGQWAGIAAAVVVGTVVTVATAGLAGPVVGTVAAGIIGGIVGGAAAGAVGEVVEATVDDRPITASNVIRAAAVGAVVGGVLSGAGAAVNAGLRTAAGRAATARVAASAVGRGVQAAARSAPGRAVQSAAGVVGRAGERLQAPFRRAGEAVGRRIPGSAVQRAEASAAQRAAETQMDVLGNAESRSTAAATGDETFVHQAGRHAAFPGQAEASVEAQRALRLSPGGQTGHYGEGAYAFRGTLEQFPGAHFEFTVPPGTAVEAVVTRTSSNSIQRLVPPAGQSSVPINIIRMNVAEDTLQFGRQVMGSALPPRTPFTLLQPGAYDRLSFPAIVGGTTGLTIRLGPSDPLPNPANLPDQPAAQLPALKFQFGP